MQLTAPPEYGGLAPLSSFPALAIAHLTRRPGERPHTFGVSARSESEG
jgi:hypothetical protein